MVHKDATVQIRKDGFIRTFKVTDLIERRVSAPLAQACYEELTPESELRKYKDWFIGKARPEIRERGAGRPTKKERRSLDTFKRDSS
jgi:ribosome-associated heat shock protein Hsp15